MDSIQFGVQTPKGTGFDRRPNPGMVKPTYVKGEMGASKTQGARQKGSQGMTGTSNGRGKNGFGKPGPQDFGGAGKKAKF